MIKYFKNGILEAETLDLPQDCGDIKVSVSVEQELEDACYYLEFSCPRNVKYISQRLEKVEDGKFELLLPRGISEYMGEVYVQLVIMSKTEAKLISRSLIARDPLFVIKESILASNALESSERRDFFEYSQNVVSNAQIKIDEIDNLVENMPSVIDGKIENSLTEINKAILGCNEKIANNSKDIANKIDNSQIAQRTGTSQEMIMSQKAVSNEINAMMSKSQLVQVLGTSSSSVVSQKGLFKAFAGTLDLVATGQNAVTIDLADPKYDTSNGRCICWQLFGYVSTSSTLNVTDNGVSKISATDAIGFIMTLQTKYVCVLVFKKSGTIQSYCGLKNTMKLTYQSILGPLITMDSYYIREGYEN